MALPYGKRAFLNSPGLHPGEAWQRSSGPKTETEHVVNGSGPHAPICPMRGLRMALCVCCCPLLMPSNISREGGTWMAKGWEEGATVW